MAIQIYTYTQQTMSNATELITPGTSLDVSSDIQYSAVTVRKSGGKSVKVLDTSGRRLTLSTPLMLTWGVNENDYEDSGRKSYDMSLQFPSEGYQNQSTRAFFENMKAFENKLIEDVMKNSKEWLNKGKVTREVVEALMNPMLRYPKDKETGEPDMTRMPTLRIKLDYWDEKFSCEIYDVNQRALFTPQRGDCRDGCDGGPADIITKTSHVATIIQCGGIYFSGGKFGVTWSLVQAIVRQPVRITGSCFIRLDDDDREQMQTLDQRDAEEEANASGDDDATPGNNETSVFVADSDDDDEDEDEEEAAPPTPPPQPKKKRVVRRKKKAAEEEA